MNEAPELTPEDLEFLFDDKITVMEAFETSEEHYLKKFREAYEDDLEDPDQFEDLCQMVKSAFHEGMKAGFSLGAIAFEKTDDSEEE